MKDDVKAICTIASKQDGRHVSCPRCRKVHTCNWNFGHTEEEIANCHEINYFKALMNQKLCDRCQQVLLEFYPNHPSIPYIKVAIEKQKRIYNLL